MARPARASLAHRSTSVHGPRGSGRGHHRGRQARARLSRRGGAVNRARHRTAWAWTTDEAVPASRAQRVTGVALHPPRRSLRVCKSNEEVPVTGSIFLLPLSAYWLTAACSEAVVFDEPCMWQFHSILFVILRSSPIGEVAAEMITDKMLSSQVCANVLSTRS